MRYILALLILLTPLPAFAQSGLTTDSKDPVEITANGSLEWHRNDLRFIARENALAKQGDASIAAETLTALYRKGETSSMEVYRLEARGEVILTSADNKAYGDNADYNLDEGLATMTGEDLKMISPDQTVTAEDKFEYWSEEGRLNAIGNAKIIRPKLEGGFDTLSAQKISALLKDNEKGERVLHTMEAFGGVTIVTPTETVTGDYGIFRAASNKAELKGNVKIKRGPNVLEGERAEVDLTTNISKIFGQNGQKTGRVRGVFYPDAQKKPDNNSESE